MSRQSLAARASVAVLLTIGFYLLALAVAGGLLVFVYAELRWGRHVYIKPTIFAVVGAGVILWSILPRWDRFTAPGPMLSAAKHPDLFRLLEEVARATGQQMPAEVYLVGDVNAWVMQRGGIMGFGSRRVMGLGLPLLQTVTVSQLRAILAHEFGHYHGGDTSLGPWIYKTRMALGRTIENLAKSGGYLHKPFLWYGNLFMRVTQAISRAQELAADRLAATVAGARNAMDALIAVQRSGAAYDAYWQTEVIPVLSNGFRPPIAAGLTHFLGADSVSKSLQEHIDKELEAGVSDEFDSHPPLRERLDALKLVDDGTVAEASPLASTLLRDLDALEQDFLLSIAADQSAVQRLSPIAWEESGDRVYLPVWKKNVEEHASALRDVRLAALPDVKALPALAARLTLKDVPDDERTQAASSILGCAIAVALAEDGWAVDARPGIQVTLSKGDHSIQPFAVSTRLGAGEMTAEEWTAECGRVGVVDRALA
jgi:Zn-dependent protease with chaperone function